MAKWFSVREFVSATDATLCSGSVRTAIADSAIAAWLAAPKPGEADHRTLVRRIYSQPVPLPSRARHEPDGWMPRSLDQGPVFRTLGPYVVSGGWWRKAVHREYHYAETRKGELLWIYYDRPRRRWFLHGRVE